MPKLKTHSGAKKRFNLTKSGKVKRAHGFQEPHPHQEGHQAHAVACAAAPMPTCTNEATIRKMIPYK